MTIFGSFLIENDRYASRHFFLALGTKENVPITVTAHILGRTPVVSMIMYRKMQSIGASLKLDRHFVCLMI